MPNELNTARCPRLGVEINNSPASAEQSTIQHAALQALQTDNWDAFEALALKDHATRDIEFEYDDLGGNCLHVAVKAGSQQIVANLAILAREKNIDLINTTDRAGYTPIMYAAESSIDHADLVNTLIKAGAYGGFAEALKAAVLNGHAKTAKLLIDAGAGTTTVLAEIVAGNAGHIPAETAKAAALLISLGANVSDALDYAVKHSSIEVVRTLLLLGAKGSDALAVAAVSRDMHALARLISAGADVATALIHLAKHSDKGIHYWAVTRLIAADHKARRHNAYGKLRNETMALVRLAKNGDLATMTTLCRAVAPEHLGWEQLALSGNVGAIKALIASCSSNHAEKYLASLVCRGHTMAAKTLIQAGVPTSRTLTTLFHESNHSGYLIERETIEQLLATGADSSILPAEISEAINNRKIEISALSPDERNVALLSAIRTENQADVAMLLHQGANPIAVLRQLNPSNERLSISRLITTGALSSQDIIDLAKAGDMATVTVLAQIEDILTDALGELIAAQDQDTARMLLAASLCGYRALEQAVQRDDSYTATTLMAIGANGSEALLSLLTMGHREAAARLIALGVDIHTALMVAVRDDRDFHQNAIQELTAIGADYSRALSRAIERRDTKAAGQLLNQMDTQAGQKAVWNLIEDDTLAVEIKTARLRFLLQLEVNTDDVLNQLVEDRAFVKLRLLITLGAVTDGLLMDLGKQGNRIGAETLIRAGADYATAIAALKDNHEQDAVTVLTLSLTGARDRVIGGSAL